jgi:hypothetical protein
MVYTMRMRSHVFMQQQHCQPLESLPQGGASPVFRVLGVSVSKGCADYGLRFAVAWCGCHTDAY